MNPFAQLDVHDDEDDYVQTPSNTNKLPKKTHHQRKLVKQQKIQEAQNQSKRAAQVTNEQVPQKIKEDNKTRNYKPRPNKQLTSGHYLDRRSGTGKDDRPRKGRGNVGNLNDEMNKQKFEKQQNAEITEQPQQEKKPEEPQGMTLEEYYKSKGIELSNTENKKQPVKKADIKADWIKKQKLEVLKTKEDKKAESQQKRANKKQRNTEKVGISANANAEILGFGTKPQRKPEPAQQEPRQRGQKGGKDQRKPKRQEKVVLKEEDFPAL